MIDLMGKTIGIMTTLMYTLDGSMKTMNSAWNGPPGQLVQTLGKCFHPDTLVRLKDNVLVKISDVKAGDILKDDNRVIATMVIDNSQNNEHEPEKLFVIPNAGEKGTDIYVTGSHYVYDYENNNDIFIQVKNYNKAVAQDQVTSDKYVCFVTENHTIQIGEMIFWDWEDYRLS
jgi:hypothetical protein